MSKRKWTASAPPGVTSWDRIRFHASPEDNRCVGWPPPGPYWESGYGDTYSIIVGYVPHGYTDKQITKHWPEATHIDRMQTDVPLTFSDRFPKPSYWTDEGGAS